MEPLAVPHRMLPLLATSLTIQLVNAVKEQILFCAVGYDLPFVVNVQSVKLQTDTIPGYLPNAEMIEGGSLAGTSVKRVCLPVVAFSLCLLCCAGCGQTRAVDLTTPGGVHLEATYRLPENGDGWISSRPSTFYVGLAL